jgi:hypothetical protein
MMNLNKSSPVEFQHALFTNIYITNIHHHESKHSVFSNLQKHKIRISRRMINIISLIHTSIITESWNMSIQSSKILSPVDMTVYLLSSNMLFA